MKAGIVLGWSYRTGRSNWLYYFDAADRENRVTLLNTVSDIREGFTRRDYKGAWEARRVMHLLVLPSERDFENMVR